MVHYDIYVSIDVGALCSGFAIATAKRNLDGTLLDLGIEASPQRPTSQYLPQTITAQSRTVQYGIEFSKLSLLADSAWNTTTADQNIVREVVHSLNSHGSFFSSSSELVAQIIRSIWDEAMLQVRETLDRERRARRRGPRVHAVFTYPATWSHSAQGRFARAVELAGVSNDAHEISYMTEGKAAGAAVMYDFKLETEHLPAIVADCGGITIDTVMIRSSTNQDSLIDEQYEQSKLYGVYSVDLAYRRLLESKVAEASGGKMANGQEHLAAIDDALIKWRDTQRNRFESRSFLFHGSPAIAVNGNMIEVHRDEVVHCFDEVSRIIAGMIISHLEQLPTQADFIAKVFLTGGLSLNSVVQDKLPLLLSSGLKDMQVKLLSYSEGKQALTSVCRGAALYTAHNDRVA